MPKVLIMSDSHGLTEEVVVIKNRHANEVDQMIHCGDSELPAKSAELEGFMKVGGNCDMDSNYPDEVTFKVGDLNFFVAHGHLHQVKSTLMPISYKAEEVGANIICFGHSHIAGVERVDQKLFINPGSIRLPRLRREPTYAILSWGDLSTISVNFFTVDGELVEDLRYSTSL